MDDSEIRFYEFGDFRLDARRGKLYKRGEFAAITKRQFALLLFLVQNSGQILEHDEILEKVWDGLFVEQSNLKKGISALRQILQEVPGENGFIKTVPRRGYKFDAPVRFLSGDPAGQEIVFIRRTNAEITIEEEIETGEISGRPAGQDLPPAPAAANLSAIVKRHKITLAAAICLLLVGSGLALKSWFAPRPILFSAENVEITKVTSEGNLYGTFISPDGNYIAYIFGEKEGKGLRVKHLPTGSITQLVKIQNAGFWTAGFSPDGNFVYYGVENFDDRTASGLYKIPFLGGEPKRLFKQAVSDLTFAPDGTRIAFSHETENLDTELVTANPEGDDVRRIAVFTPDLHLDGVSFAPDGQSLLTAVRRQVSVNKLISYVSEFSISDGSEKIVVPEQEKKITSPLWLPGKNSLLMSVREANSEIYKIRQYFPAGGEWRRVVNDNNTYRLLSLARDGQTLVSTREIRVASVWLTGDRSTDSRQISEGAGGYDRLTWTRDGRIVYASPETPTDTFWIMDADGGHKKQLTDGKDGIRLFPQISGDGAGVTFNSYRSGSRQIWRVGLDGENLTRLTDVETGAANGYLLSDNQTLIYSSFIKPNGSTIFKRTAGGQTLQLSVENTDIFAVSPDEHLIAYAAQNEQKKNQIFVRSIDDGKLIKTFDFEPLRELRWTRDGQALAYDTKKDDTSQIVIQPLDGSPPQTVFSLRSEKIFWFDWSFDGTKLAVVRGQQLADAVVIKSAEN